MLVVGTNGHLICIIESPRVTRIQWEDRNDNILSDDAELDLYINDSIHEAVFSCRGYRSRTIAVELQVIVIGVGMQF